MVEFWANRIEFNLERLEEVPNRLKDKVRIYLEEREGK